MKLYKVTRNTMIKINTLNGGEPFYFHHVDGMYSLCSLTKDSDEYFHIAAWSEVEIVNGESHRVKGNQQGRMP